MKSSAGRLFLLGTGVAFVLGALSLRSDEPARTGPQTENRFPPLQVPAGFKATLFACDPLIEYPSAMCIGPRPGALFVAADFMTGLGTDLVRPDEIRLVEDTDGDGYADKATVFARGFNSIQGLAYHNGTLFVMHAPYLTALRDTKGTGVADERRDLLTGLGLTPKENRILLHCANGIVAGYDGWLYLAVGDHGVDVRRPEGDRLVLQGGGILRCRPDGSDLHVFATGLRNIYDVALDAELNVFVRDNENDGGTYMIRVCHSFFGADHGYPYHYAERPEEALPPLADLGLGSSAGGVCYLEKQFPPEYRGNLFFCEWGGSVVRYPLRRAGSGFAPVKQQVFATGAPNDPYPFKPTDIVVQRDGTMMVCDWADGQRPKRGRGRIYHITYTGAPVVKPQPEPKGTGPSELQWYKHREKWLAQLDSEGYYERCEAQRGIRRSGRDGIVGLDLARARGQIGLRGRLHEVWIKAHYFRESAIGHLLHVAADDPEASVRVQAVRAMADLADPVLVRHRLDGGPGDAALAARLAALGRVQDERVVLEIVIALGRLRWAGLPAWLKTLWTRFDPPLAHATMQALRRCENWPAILEFLDAPDTEPVRVIALRALAEQYEPAVVDGVIERLKTATESTRRREYADALTRVYKKPGPWLYWGYRPPPRPANTVNWERSDAIAQALDRILADPDRSLRLAILRRMMREQVPVRAVRLAEWLKDEYQAEHVGVILAALAKQPAAEVRPSLEAVVRDRRHDTANRRTALDLILRGRGAGDLLVLAETLEDGPILAEVLRRTSKQSGPAIIPVLTRKLKSLAAEVRAAAIEALGELRAVEGNASLLPLLKDSDASVRRAAAGAAGKLGARQAIEPLLKLATAGDSDVRRASLDALRRLGEPRAVPLAVAALEVRSLELTALECVGELGGPEQAAAVAELAKRTPSAEVPAAAVRILTMWRNREGLKPAVRHPLDDAVAQVQGANGILVRWQADEQTLFATGTEGRVLLAPKSGSKDAWLANTDVKVPAATPVEFLASSRGRLQVWLNGQSMYRREQARKYQIDSDRFAGTLVAGNNRLRVEVGPGSGAVEFHLHFRRKSAKGNHERLTQAALTRGGNPERGRKLFLDVEKSLCLKCHRLGAQGERFGPELTGVGSRFSRIYLVESILEPSRTIAPSFGTLVVALKNGKVLTGVKVAETETMLTLADNQGQKHAVARADIAEQQPSPVSTMPEGLEQRFREDEFVDLIAFLMSQRKE